jgi:hypothetical protein
MGVRFCSTIVEQIWRSKCATTPPRPTNNPLPIPNRHHFHASPTPSGTIPHNPCLGCSPRGVEHRGRKLLVPAPFWCELKLPPPGKSSFPTPHSPETLEVCTYNFAPPACRCLGSMCIAEESAGLRVTGWGCMYSPLVLRVIFTGKHVWRKSFASQVTSLNLAAGLGGGAWRRRRGLAGVRHVPRPASL